MSKVRRPWKASRGKPTLIYLGVLFACSLVLFLLTLITVFDLGGRWLSLNHSNLRKWETDMETALQRESWNLAGAVFLDRRVDVIAGDLSITSGSETRLNSLQSRHPIVREMFVFNGTVNFGPHISPELAKAVRPVLQLALGNTALPPDRIAVFEFSSGGSIHQAFYKPARQEGGRQLSGAGFISDLDWIRNDLFPKTWRSGIKGWTAPVDPSSDSAFVTLESVEPDATKAGRVQALDRLDQLFSFWTFRVSEDRVATERSFITKSLISTGAFSAIFIGLVGVGMYEISKTYKERTIIQLRSAFIDQVSHQLKTPLTLISLYADTLLAQEDASPDERRTYYEIIGRESARLGDMVDRVLEFSRIERGERKYVMEPGDLNTVIRYTLDAYTPWLQRSGFTIDTRLAPGLPRINFDPEAVSQAVLNLMDNARKYSGERRYIGVDTFSHSGGVVIEVRDNGVGMGPDEQDRIFDKFYRCPKTAGERGSGLGLFLVKYIADEHGASIQVDSTVGVGTRFRIIFPASNKDSISFPDTNLAAITARST